MLTTLWELLAASIVLGWTLATLPVLRSFALACYMAAVCFIGVSGFAGLAFGGLLVATFEPFGVMLPALCLASSSRRHGWLQVPRISPAEKLGLAGLILIVMLGAIGAGGDLLGANPYIWFYSGAGPMIGALALAGWALLRGQTHVLIAVLLAQVFWLAGIGSSNLYDHLSHVLLIPALTLSALLQTMRSKRGLA